MTDFVQIHDQDKPGDYLVLAKADYDPSKHRLFSEPMAQAGSPLWNGTGEEAVGPAPAAEEASAEPQKKARARR